MLVTVESTNVTDTVSLTSHQENELKNKKNASDKLVGFPEQDRSCGGSVRVFLRK